MLNMDNLLFCVLLLKLFLACGKACNDPSQPQFQCARDKKCINEELTCNGISDCADASDEKSPNCTDGCAFNGTLVQVGETGQDMEWWYTCMKSRWLISGCINNGIRYKENDTFQMITRQGIFWSKCEKLDRYHYVRQPRGCVDVYGRNVEAGTTFQLNQLFWATCLLNKTNSSVPRIGPVEVNEVRWKIEGCNDGTQNVIKDNEEFIWIIDPARLLGVQIRCRVTKEEQEWPDVLPTACVVNASETKRGKVKRAFKLIRDQCYMAHEDQIYFCTITSRVNTPAPQTLGTMSTWSNDWLLNITENIPEELTQLKKNGYSACSETSKVQPVIPSVPGSATPLAANSGRQKRSLPMFDAWQRIDQRSSNSLTAKIAYHVSPESIGNTNLV